MARAEVPAGDSLPPGRVLVLDVRPDQVQTAEVTHLSELFEDFLKLHPGFTLVPDAEMHEALDREEAAHPGCRLDEGCLAGIGRSLKAEYVLDASVTAGKGRYVLRVSLIDPANGKPTVRESESMKKLKSLAMNVGLCLDRLFRWSPSAPPPAKVDVATARTAPAGETQPAMASAPAAPAEPSRKRVMVLDLKTSGVDAKSAAALPALIAQEIARHAGYDVASADDVQRIVGLQAEKQKVGCTQDEACMVEVSRKLSAELIVNGAVGRVGDSLVLSLALVNTKEMGKAGGASETVAREEDLPAAVVPCLEKLFHWSGVQNAAFHLPAGKKLSFAILDLKPTGISKTTADNLTQVLSVTVKGIEGASVISREDIAAMLQLNAAKMEVGCGDDSCMAEIGGALGVDRLISGDVGRIGESFIVNLRLIDVRHGLVENRVNETYRGDEEQLLRAVRHAGHALLGLPFEGTGRVAITATQNAAHVFIDEEKKGQTPIPIDGLKVGRHEVRVAHDGFFDWRGQIYVDPSETTSVWAQLKERPQQWYQRWWVWTIAGVVVAGATATTIVLTRPAPTVGHGSVTF